MTESKEQILIRAYRPETDRNLILSSWLKSYRVDSRFTKHISNDDYYRYHQMVIERILSVPSTTTLIASLHDDPDTIVAWFTFNPPPDDIAHFVYVKEAFRGMGLARMLFYHSELTRNARFTHLTSPMLNSYQRKLDGSEEKRAGIWCRHPHFTYNPYLT